MEKLKGIMRNLYAKIKQLRNREVNENMPYYREVNSPPSPYTCMARTAKKLK